MINHLKRNKYHNIKKICLSRHMHDSKLESNYCNRLLSMKQKGEIKDFSSQRTFELFGARGEIICKHIVDFVVFLHTGEIQVHECKGMATQVFRLKKRLFEVCYPQIKYYVISINKRRTKCQK